MKAKPIYKIVDNKGRILIPKELLRPPVWIMEIL